MKHEPTMIEPELREKVLRAAMVAQSGRWAEAPALATATRREQVFQETLSLAKAMSERLERAGREFNTPQDYRLRLLRAHCLAMVDLLEEAALQDG